MNRDPDTIEPLSSARRLRLAFEELGPTFVKLGQLLATRPDLIPTEYADEFKVLHSQVQPLAFDEIEPVLVSHFGAPVDKIFSQFDLEARAAGSIAQVHMAELRHGGRVVVKVQRPGIEKTLLEDLGVLYLLADLLERYVPEAKVFRPVLVVDEFARTVDLETNFVIEANNIRRFQENFASEPNIKIPNVFNEYSGRRVLVMEALDGKPLSQKNALEQEGIDPESVLKTGLRCYLKMVFTDGLFHGDLHAGNMFVLPNNRIGLIDFGIVGRLNRTTQAAIANMLVALAGEDYDRLAYEYVDLAPYTENIDVDLFARDLRDLIAPYYGLTMKHVNVGKLLLESTEIAAQYDLLMPAELIMFFKSIVAIEGMGRMVVGDFNFLAYSLEFASELVQSRSEPRKIIRDVSTLGRDVQSLLAVLPRQMKQLIRRFSSPEFVVPIQFRELERFRLTVRNAANAVFLGLVIASLLLSAAVLQNVSASGPKWLGIPAFSATEYGVALVLSVLAFINYFKK